MNYPIELRRRELAALRHRRAAARSTDLPGGPPPRAGAAPATAGPSNGAPGSAVDQLPPDTVGLALSGGGIRSATFCLGVLQALTQKNRLRQVDFLSTVSGGGYTGAFLGRLFTRTSTKKSKDPCGRVQAIVADTGSPQIRWIRTHANYLLSQGSDATEGLGTLWRNLCSLYLVLAFVGVAAFGLFRYGGDILSVRLGLPELKAGPGLSGPLSVWWPLPLALLILAVFPCSLAYWLVPGSGTAHGSNRPALFAWIALTTGVGLILPGIEAFVLCSIVVTILLLTLVWLEAARLSLPARPDPSTREIASPPSTVIRNRLTRGVGVVLTLFAGSIAWVIVDTLARNLADGAIWKLMAAWGALLVPFIPFLRKICVALVPDSKGSSPGPSRGGSIPAGLKAGLLAFPIAGFLLVLLDGGVHWLFLRSTLLGIQVSLLAVALSVILGSAFDFLNYSSLQRSYNARLTRTFLGASNPARVYSSPGEGGKDVLITHPNDDMPYENYHPEENGGPLHLIGLCVNETVEAASQRDIRDRKGMSMCVGPCGVSVGRRFHSLWSSVPSKGSPLAHLPSQLGRGPALFPIVRSGEQFHVLRGKTDAPVAVEPLHLGTWIGVSGAAFGTGTGRATSLSLALLCGLANLRLGYWWNSGLSLTERPGRFAENFWRRLKRWPARLVEMQSLLLAEFQGRFGGPSQRFWNISDGGHFDNTGIYELVRRRIPFIIGVDGGEDNAYTFNDYAELVHQVRVDFGAQVEFLADPVSAIAPTAGRPSVPGWIASWINASALGPLSQIGKNGTKHAALARVTYADDPAQTSWIVLIKASVTGDESLDIAAYRSAHETFPNESTLDQFFSECQWECYRMLGEHAAGVVLA